MAKQRKKFAVNWNGPSTLFLNSILSSNNQITSKLELLSLNPRCKLGFWRSIMRWLAVFVAVTSLLCSGACSKKAPAPAQQATVLLKDGTSFAGTVTKNTSSEITLTAPTGEARTYPMSQVS